MNTHWLESAERDIDSIYDYYANDKSIKVADKIYNEIVDASYSLVNFPFMAPIERDLTSSKRQFRSLLVLKHYKIIYFIEGDFIYIAAVWDCRTDPDFNIDRTNNI